MTRSIPLLTEVPSTMTISAGLLGEFDHEMQNTRRTLERVPYDKATWKPHAKSASMGELARHLTHLPGLGIPVLTTPALDVAAERPRGEVSSTADLLRLFDQNVAATRKALSDTADADFRTPWTLNAGTRTLWTLPRMAAWRGFVMNHIIHHRAQLGVYLRLNDVPVPGIYGPSADEGI
jgi:uncharacterized damage-inducible protein DinB